MNINLAVDARAIDPAALFLHGEALEIYWLIKHPHVPSIGDIQKTLRSVSAEERTKILERAKMIGEFAKVVEEAVTTMAKQTAA
jgi:hypothetical protein